MKLAVVGTRTFDRADILAIYLDRRRLADESLVIVSGGAPGADRLAAAYARRHGLPLLQFRADWALHGRSAGPIRNRQIVAAADELVAFWDEQSRGTRISLDLAIEKRIPVIVVTYDGREYAYAGSDAQRIAVHEVVSEFDSADRPELQSPGNSPDFTNR